MGKPWSDKEEKFLVKNYSKMRNEEIGKILNRSAGSIYERARQLGIKKYFRRYNCGKPKRKGWREVQDVSYTNVCACVLDGYSFKEIAEMTNRPVAQVREIYEDGVKMGRLAAIKAYRKDSYILVKAQKYAKREVKKDGC